MLAYYFLAICVVGPVIFMTEVMGAGSTGKTETTSTTTTTTEISRTDLGGKITGITKYDTGKIEDIKQLLKHIWQRIRNDKTAISKNLTVSEQIGNQSVILEKVANSAHIKLSDVVSDVHRAKGEAESALTSAKAAEAKAKVASDEAVKARKKARDAFKNSSSVTIFAYAYLYLVMCMYVFLYI
uniref:Uncharacterized protein n=1 Tax=Meteorus pulchricornis TaxID=51522 RepID=H7CHJ2_9HYME|nr:hypothetical protein [Meteorus pulchricornis]